MKKYEVTGTVSFEVELDVESENEEQAIEKAREMINDDCHLNVEGSVVDMFFPVKYDIEADEI